MKVFSVECSLDPNIFSSHIVISDLRILWLKIVMWSLSSTESLVAGIPNTGNLQKLYSIGADSVIGWTMWCEFLSRIMLNISYTVS